MIVDGEPNSSIANAEGGVRSINDIIISPGETFSYIDTINVYDTHTEQGYQIGYGTCNSTTTLFRAALEAGFPIEERHAHSFVVDSYAWGYEYKIVDSAYFPSPRLDLRFTNDLLEPVLLSVNIYQDETYQYHEIEIRSSQSVPIRNVELRDWRIFDQYSEISFSGEFTRVVTNQFGVVIREDKFESTYR